MGAELGKTTCPVCDFEGASIRTSGKSGKPYIVCHGEEGCGFQGFARGGKAVERMLAKVRPAEKPAEKQTQQIEEKGGFWNVEI